MIRSAGFAGGGGAGRAPLPIDPLGALVEGYMRQSVWASTRYAHDRERGRRLDLREAVLERVRHEVREHHAVRRVAAHEERRHEEPEARHPRGVDDRHASRALDRRHVGGGSRGVLLYDAERDLALMPCPD